MSVLACYQVERCIDKWTSGKRKKSTWTEDRFKVVYYSYISLLEGTDLLTGIQQDLLKHAQ
jgi:hypothetical protein